MQSVRTDYTHLTLLSLRHIVSFSISTMITKQMKIGFVSRVSKTNAYEHTILGTQFYKPNEFARQITMDPKNMWGIVKEIVDLIRKQVQLYSTYG
jgi:Eukaryotic translation initiation factor 3 subunit 7 (eIF-3)